jgi:hypothetical protein
VCKRDVAVYMTFCCDRKSRHSVDVESFPLTKATLIHMELHNIIPYYTNKLTWQQYPSHRSSSAGLCYPYCASRCLRACQALNLLSRRPYIPFTTRFANRLSPNNSAYTVNNNGYNGNIITSISIRNRIGTVLLNSEISL